VRGVGQDQATNLRAHPLHDVGGGGGVRLHQQQPEFIAAHSRDDIAAADGAAQQLGKAAQGSVPGDMAMSVIQSLEPVKITHDQRQRAAITPGIGDGAHGGLIQPAPVEHVRQRIMPHLPPQLVRQIACDHHDGGHARADIDGRQAKAQYRAIGDQARARRLAEISGGADGQRRLKQREQQEHGEKGDFRCIEPPVAGPERGSRAQHQYADIARHDHALKRAIMDHRRIDAADRHD